MGPERRRCRARPRRVYGRSRSPRRTSRRAAAIVPFELAKVPQLSQGGGEQVPGRSWRILVDPALGLVVHLAEPDLGGGVLVGEAVGAPELEVGLDQVAARGRPGRASSRRSIRPSRRHAGNRAWTHRTAGPHVDQTEPHVGLVEDLLGRESSRVIVGQCRRRSAAPVRSAGARGLGSADDPVDIAELLVGDGLAQVGCGPGGAPLESPPGPGSPCRAGSGGVNASPGSVPVAPARRR